MFLCEVRNLKLRNLPNTVHADQFDDREDCSVIRNLSLQLESLFNRLCCFIKILKTCLPAFKKRDNFYSKRYSNFEFESTQAYKCLVPCRLQVTNNVRNVKKMAIAN